MLPSLWLFNIKELIGYPTHEKWRQQRTTIQRTSVQKEGRERYLQDPGTMYFFPEINKEETDIC